jgi:AAA15 family ATPase/GTPase
MIRAAIISNFKGIKNADINDLSSVNLFIGKNNACKSTILEALYYAIKEVTGASLTDLIGRRTDIPSSARELWYNYETRSPIQVLLSYGDLVINFNILFEDNRIIRSSSELRSKLGSASVYSRRRDYSSDSTDGLRSYISSTTGSQLETLSNNITDYSQNSCLIDSSIRKDVRATESLLGKLKLDGRSEEFGEYLENIFGTGKHWEFLPSIENPDTYRAAIMVEGKPLFFSGLGDGIRYGLQIVGKTMDTKNSAVYIEEIESHQHPEALKKIIPFLVELALKNKSQLFITTHSPLVWTIFEKEFETEESRRVAFRCYHVKRETKNGAVSCTLQTKANADEFFSEVHKDLFGK